MKLSYILATVASVAMLASCSCNKNDEKAAQEKAAQEAQAAEAQAQKDAAKAARKAAKAATPSVQKGYDVAYDFEDEDAANTQLLHGIITAIDGDKVNIAGNDGKDYTVLITDKSQELIEGSPITVAYKTAEDGSLTNAAETGAVAVPKDYSKILGKWATEKNAITFEMRKRGKCKNVGKGQNVEFKSWKLANDTILFHAKSGDAEFDMPWALNVNELENNDQLVLTQGTSTLNFSRIDSERE